jgi:hypothetical protein
MRDVIRIRAEFAYLRDGPPVVFWIDRVGEEELGSALHGVDLDRDGDGGTEFTSKALDHRAYWNRVKLDFSRPGKPTDDAHVEAFNPVRRRECLSQHWFIDLEDAQRVLDRWRADYNHVRPHGSLARSTLADFAAGALFTPGPEKLEDSRFWWTRTGVRSTYGPSPRSASTSS